jgi:hydrogenase maturation protease
MKQPDRTAAGPQAATAGKTLVLGLGNDLYGDDGVGIHIIQRLESDDLCRKKFADCLAGVDLLASGLTGLALLDVIVGYDRLVIVDTIKRSSPRTGRIHVLDADKLRHIPGPSPHYVSIPQTITAGRQLGLHVPEKIRVIGVEAKNLYFLGEGLTETMQSAVPDILDALKSVLTEDRL